jgi:hypothetical protein
MMEGGNTSMHKSFFVLGLDNLINQVRNQEESWLFVRRGRVVGSIGHWHLARDWCSQFQGLKLGLRDSLSDKRGSMDRPGTSGRGKHSHPLPPLPRYP